MKTLDKINFLLDALEDGETNFRFDENKWGQKKMNRTLNRIKDLYARGTDSVRNEMEESESVSWQRMIRVLTHEIMNTVAPISSLSQTLKKADSKELDEGLDTISASCQGLIRFVNSYHGITHLNAPSRTAFYVRDVVSDVIGLTESYGIPVRFQERTPDVLLYADKEQIRQILVNLVKNAWEADANRVDISAEIAVDESIIINVSNDGTPISADDQNLIFDPFYTTKASGSGIGLSLSRQIMHRHGGSLCLKKSDSHTTVFSLVFP